MSTIETAGSLRPGTADTPLDQRTRVNSTADISNIELPYLGMLVYCIETGKYYKITKLKAKQLGALTVPDAAVDTYEELGASSDGDFIQQLRFPPLRKAPSAHLQRSRTAERQSASLRFQAWSLLQPRSRRQEPSWCSQ